MGWTTLEERRLVDLVGQKWTTQDIAKEFHRTPCAIRNRFRLLRKAGRSEGLFLHDRRSKKVGKYTQSELAVLTIWQVAHRGFDEAMMRSGFSEVELAVMLWKKHPTVFGLKGYEQLYPDNKAVCVMLCQRQGPIHRGWIERALPSRVRLTELGIQKAQELEKR